MPRTPRRKTQPYHHGDLRQALIDAALEVIDGDNVAAVSLRQLARRVGVTYAAPYHHFKDKEALLCAVATQGFRKLNECIDRAAADSATDDPLACIQSMGRGYVHFAVTHPSHYRVMFGPSRHDESGDPELEQASSESFDRLQRAAAALLGPGATDEQHATVAVTAWSLVHGLSMLWNDGPLADKFSEFTIEQLSAMVSGTLGAHLATLLSHDDTGRDDDER